MRSISTRTYVWVTVLAGLMFASGVAAGVLSVRVVGGDSSDSGRGTHEDAQACERSDRGGRGDLARGRRDGGPGGEHRGGRPQRRGDHHDGRRGDSHRRSLGPHMDALRLPGVELTDVQQSEVDRLIAESTARVQQYEKQIGDELCAARQAVHDVLTADQREALDREVREMFEKMREQRTTELVTWLAEQPAVDGENLEFCREAIAEWMTQKGEYFRGARERGEWPEKDEMRAALREIDEVRDDRLAEVLDEETLREFRRRAEFRGGPHDRFRDGDRDRGRRSKGESREFRKNK